MFPPAIPHPAAHSVRLLDGGAEAYPRMLAAIGSARQAVHLEVYQYDLDATGDRFADALAAAARRGVRVRVVVDGVGSAFDGRSLAAQLRSAGADASIYHPLSALLLGRFRRDHRKLLLVDGEVAFLGGINIGDAYVGAEAPWADLAAEVRGPVCAWLADRLRRRRGSPPPGPVRVWVSGRGGGRRLRRRYLKAIGAARRSVLIAHGYFLPDRRLVRSITAAARRGVEVTLLLAGRSDIRFARAATRRLHARLLRAGVHIHEWDRSVLHAKVAAMDGERLLLGSFNLDPLSLANLESLLEVHDPEVAREGAAWIERHLATARPVGAPEAAGPGRWRRAALDALGAVAFRVARLTARVLASGRRRRGRTSSSRPP